MTPEFQRLTMRTGTSLDGVGIVMCQVDDEVTRSLGAFQEAIADLT